MKGNAVVTVVPAQRAGAGRRAARSLVGWLAIATVVAEEGLVERAEELGLIHATLAGLDRVGVDTRLLDWAQAGAALGDIDGDGDLDVVACGGLLGNHVFRNDGDRFTDVTEAAGVGSAELDRVPALGDYDGDGDLDLFLGALEPGDGPLPGRSRLYRNDGGGRFEDVTALAGTTGAGHSLYAQWADVDLDGWLDLYVGEFHGTENQLYRNNGDGSFSEVAAEAGLDHVGSSHVVAVVDLDRDHRPDVCVGNDFVIALTGRLEHAEPDAFLHGEPSAAWRDVTDASGMGQPATTMGMTFGDVDYDGRLDVYKTEFQTNFLLLNRGWPTSGVPFEHAEYTFGVANEVVPDPVTGGSGFAVGWGAAFVDLDLDRWLDLVVVNGHVAAGDPRGQRNALFRGLGPGHGFAFEDATEELGWADAHDDRGLAVGDVDRDGDVDLLVVPTAGPLRYYENRLERGGRGSLHVRARTATSAPGGIGVRVDWTDALGHPHTRVIGADAPTASQPAAELVLGLGDEAAIELVVEFPSGIRRRRTDVPAGSRVVIDEPLLVELSSRKVSVDEAGGPFVVTAYAHSVEGEPLADGAEVSIEMDGVEPLGPVVHRRGPVYERTFTVPETAGSYRARVSFDGFEVRIQPRLVVHGPVTSARTTVQAVPACVRAGSDDRFRVTVVPRDALGLPVGAGRSVRVRLLPDGVERTAHDLGDGRYRVELGAPAEVGRRSIVVQVDGVGLASDATVDVAGPASVAHGTLYLEEPGLTDGASPHQLRAIVTPRDADGLCLGPAAELEVSVFPAAGSEPIAVLEAPARGAQDDGDTYFVLERPAGTPPASASGTLQVLVDGVVAVEADFEL